jgi:hypothetical protein
LVGRDRDELPALFACVIEDINAFRFAREIIQVDRQLFPFGHRCRDGSYSVSLHHSGDGVSVGAGFDPHLLHRAAHTCPDLRNRGRASRLDDDALERQRYTNVSGAQVHGPAYSTNGVLAGATAQ